MMSNLFMSLVENGRNPFDVMLHLFAVNAISFIDIAMVLSHDLCKMDPCSMFILRKNGICNFITGAGAPIAPEPSS